MAIILLTALASITIATTTEAFIRYRDNQVALENKAASVALAQGCAELARADLAQEPGFTGPKQYSIHSKNCSIDSVTTGTASIIIRSSATSNGIHTSIQTVLNLSLLTILAQQEISP